MPPKKKKSKDISEEKEVNKELKRRFVHMSQISQHLNCSFCYEVFIDPVRVNCKHTFCRGCIEQWIDNSKNAGAPCPICRSIIKKKDIQRDLLAFQIINDFEIFCTNIGCKWQGPLSNLPNHLKSKCNFKAEKVPNWF